MKITDLSCNTVEVRLSSIDLSDDIFKTSYFYDLNEIQPSVSLHGVIERPFLQKKDSKNYRIISGFKRIEAAKIAGIEKVLIFVVEDTVNQLELYLLFLSQNKTVREFNIVEKARIVKTLKTVFNMDEGSLSEELKKTINFCYNKKHGLWMEKLLSFPENIQKAFAFENMSYELIAYMHEKLNTDERERFFGLIESLKLGKNKQKDFARIIDDIVKINNTTYGELFKEIILKDYMQKKTVTPAQKYEKLMSGFKKTRFPNLKTAEENYQKWVNNLKLPCEITAKHSPFFESDAVSCEFKFNNSEDFRKILEDFKRIEENGSIREMDKGFFS